MKIKKIEITNYRNLDGITAYFSSDCNFIVGENNVGKSNLLSILNTVFNFSSFRIEDFYDETQPIEIKLQLELVDIELGLFQDLFTIDNYSIINITCRQNTADDNIEFFHEETNTFIQPSVIRCINFVYYDSLRNPIAEINFDKGRGVGRFLRNIIAQYLIGNGISEQDFYKKGQVNALLKEVNGKFSKIKSFTDFNIHAALDDDMESQLSKAVILKDGNDANLVKAGYGIQYLLLITLAILEKIQLINRQKRERGIFIDEVSEKKSISLILALDEPEIHLHPYMQRSLINYINLIISNQNIEFSQLIKEMFDIDFFNGQIIIVTHSPSCLLNDYKQIHRMYSDKGKTKIISGTQLSLTRQQQKHLYIQFPFIKEAFFARSVIFVEGDTEFSSFPYFAKKMGINFDDLGICLIQGHGEKAIPVLIELANDFGIPSIGISDKDTKNSRPTTPNHLFTTKRDFESEIVALVNKGKINVLENILTNYDSSGFERFLEKEALNSKAFTKFHVVKKPFTSGLKYSEIDKTNTVDLIAYLLTWFAINKSYPLGIIIGEELKKEDIPSVYKKVILSSRKIIKHA